MQPITVRIGSAASGKSNVFKGPASLKRGLAPQNQVIVEHGKGSLHAEREPRMGMKRRLYGKPEARLVDYSHSFTALAD